ncbi:hypothetical protein PspLS_11663 [Pyricularia sp. CBS 133598]|nr:hypothetical protein PspLS_11663 [Pyricularia sp. CBS 133598]
MSIFGAIAYDFLVGAVAYSGSGFGSGEASVLLTSIASCAEFPSINDFLNSLKDPRRCPSGSVVQTVEQLFHNVTVSVLSSAIFGNKTARVEVNVETTRNRYVYQATALWQAYSAAIDTALVCVVVGLHALFTNGYSASKSFSAIMLATRNPELDRLISKEDVESTKLGYGVISDWINGKEKSRAAFGLEKTVKLVV